jgi:hypothetical protein
MMLSTDMDPQAVASTILRQMGGIQRIAMMTGAVQFVTMNDGVQFKFKGSRKANCVRVTLDPSDTYTVEFYRITKRGLDVKTVKTLTGCYCDMLKPLFEETTGLYLSL